MRRSKWLCRTGALVAVVLVVHTLMSLGRHDDGRPRPVHPPCVSTIIITTTTATVTTPPTSKRPSTVSNQIKPSTLPSFRASRIKPSPLPAHRNPFVPSYEWQVVQEGQAIPVGLYIKMDLQTGYKMARLMHDRPGITLLSERHQDSGNRALSGGQRRRARIAREHAERLR
jgi:hypothetical protein